ncbi:hypothetical protein KZZ52_33655 [Dactylosporangium sp. AC04546]|uniref:hypothetical protein n=1 Tax=Dactylosporangium sp. AC04546 TaxID=2862460 RepID=UPI001EDE1572|nr:hypothetical protein [Dactylosporangium sp. AC04546]WVK78922.1 hypothetical protein KZZ52_33655 [Dactylosporangium sp. AC04546]
MGETDGIDLTCLRAKREQAQRLSQLPSLQIRSTSSVDEADRMRGRWDDLLRSRTLTVRARSASVSVRVFHSSSPRSSRVMSMTMAIPDQ